MQRSALRLLSIVFILILFILFFPSYAKAADPTSTPSSTGTSTPTTTVTVTPSVSASPTPSSSPTVSATNTSTPTTVLSSPTPTSKAVGGTTKKDVLGKTSVLGSTGAEREIAKWAVALFAAAVSIFVGLKIARSNNAQE